jgi:hypothetical protein
VDAAEREAILADWRAEAAVPVPPDTSAVGCTVAILAVAVAALVPAVLRPLGVTLPAGAGGVILGTLGVAFAWGVFKGLTGRSRGFNSVAERAAEALGRLTTHPQDRGPEARRAAVTLIQCAFYSSGPSTVATFDFAAARDRLGPALPFVLEVESVLVADARTYPVFTVAD